MYMVNAHFDHYKKQFQGGIKINKTVFCYEIHADAGLAHDTVTGEKAKAYTKVEFEFKRRLNEEEYKKVHEQEIIPMLSYQLKINEQHFRPISMAEFLENHDDEN